VAPAVLGAGQLTNGSWGSELRVDLMLIAVGQKLVNFNVSALQFPDFIGGHRRRKPFLVIVMTTFDSTFGLEGRRAPQAYAVEV
jgi:hypothetical protein